MEFTYEVKDFLTVEIVKDSVDLRYAYLELIITPHIEVDSLLVCSTITKIPKITCVSLDENSYTLTIKTPETSKKYYNQMIQIICEFLNPYNNIFILEMFENIFDFYTKELNKEFAESNPELYLITQYNKLKIEPIYTSSGEFRVNSNHRHMVEIEILKQSNYGKIVENLIKFSKGIITIEELKENFIYLSNKVSSNITKENMDSFEIYSKLIGHIENTLLLNNQINYVPKEVENTLYGYDIGKLETKIKQNSLIAETLEVMDKVYTNFPPYTTNCFEFITNKLNDFRK